MHGELAGYLQMAIGLAGIVVTILATPNFLSAANEAKSDGAGPLQLNGFAPAIRLFCIVFVLIVFGFLIAMGLSLTLNSLAVALGAERPFLSASMIVAALISLSVSLTLHIYGKAWTPALIGTATLTAMSLIAAMNSNPVLLWSIAGIGTLVTSALVVLAHHGLLEL